MYLRLRMALTVATILVAGAEPTEAQRSALADRDRCPDGVDVILVAVNVYRVNDGNRQDWMEDREEASFIRWEVRTPVRLRWVEWDYSIEFQVRATRGDGETKDEAVSGPDVGRVSDFEFYEEDGSYRGEYTNETAWSLRWEPDDWADSIDKHESKLDDVLIHDPIRCRR